MAYPRNVKKMELWSKKFISVWCPCAVKLINFSRNLTLMSMKYLWMAFLFLLACSSKTPMPEAPASSGAAATLLAGKTWTVTRTGTVSPLGAEGKLTYEWLDEMKEVDDFTKKNLSELAGMQLKFVNDTLANVTGVPDSPLEQKYSITIDENVDLSAPILQFSYEGESLFGGDEKMMMTYSYPIYGINEKSLVLGTPRSVNNRPVVVMLEVK